MPRVKKRASRKSRPDREDLLKKLGHRFSDPALLDRALIHSSYAHEKGMQGADNESMEFLGDAVLSLGVSLMLFGELGEGEVGKMARHRAFLVSERNLASKARGLELGEHLKLGRGEEKGGGRSKESLLADAWEAVLAAIYLDGGLQPALVFMERVFGAQVARLRSTPDGAQDYKTELQEALQAVGLPLPKYRVAGESGPDHRKSFRVEVVIQGRVAARGSGPTKKAAEQKAARQALRHLEKVLERLSSG